MIGAPSTADGTSTLSPFRKLVKISALGAARLAIASSSAGTSFLLPPLKPGEINLGVGEVAVNCAVVLHWKCCFETYGGTIELEHPRGIEHDFLAPTMTA